MSVTVNH